MLARFFSRTLSSLAPPSRRIMSSSSSSEADDVPFESLKPSAEFEKQLTREQREKYKKTLNEFEIFAYMAKYVPRQMTDFDWKRTLQCESLNEKLQFWEFLAMTHRRKSRKDSKSNEHVAKYKEHMIEQQRIHDNGGMGYGPELYQLITNPTRNQKRVNNCQGARVLSSMTAGAPKIALDLQYIAEMSLRESGELGNQMQFVISENFMAKNPLVLDFVNAPSVEFSEKWLAKSVGYYTGSYQNQTILPDFSTKNIKQFYGKGQKMIYLSSHARDVLDGPLTADVIGVCVSMNRKREALSAARRAGIPAFRLPIHRYVKWKSGPQVLPFPNLLNVLRTVHDTNGDWKTALHNNISRRHLVDANDDEYKKLATLKRKAREEERRELAEAIISATQG